MARSRGRKSSNAFRAIGEGRKVNVDFGVEIITLDFLGEPTGWYEVRGPALNDYGYIVVGSFDRLSEARKVAVATVEALRERSASFYVEALRENGREVREARERLLAEIAEAEATVPADAPKPVKTLVFLARMSAESGFLDAGHSRLGRLRSMLDGATPVISDDEAAAALAQAEADFPIGTRVRTTRDDAPATINGRPRIEAETNRVFIPLRFGRRGYASRYANEITGESN